MRGNPRFCRARQDDVDGDGKASTHNIGSVRAKVETSYGFSRILMDPCTSVVGRCRSSCVCKYVSYSPHFIAQILILFFKNFEYYMWIFKKFYETKSSCKKVFPISSWNTLIWKKSWKLNICLFIWTWLWKYFFRVLAVKIFLGF